MKRVTRFLRFAPLAALCLLVLMAASASAEEYTKIGLRDLPFEPHFVVSAETRDARDVAIYAVDQGDKFLVRYTLPTGLRVEMRVRPDGTVGVWQRAENQPLGNAAAKELFAKEETAFRRRADRYVVDLRREIAERERREAARREAELRRRIREASQVFSARNFQQVRNEEMPFAVRNAIRDEFLNARLDARDRERWATAEYYTFVRNDGGRFGRDETVYAVHYDSIDRHRIESLYGREGQPLGRIDLTDRAGGIEGGGWGWRQPVDGPIGGPIGGPVGGPVGGDWGQPRWIAPDRLPREARAALERETRGQGGTEFYEYRDRTRVMYAIRFRNDRGRLYETRCDELGRILDTVALDDQGRPIDPRAGGGVPDDGLRGAVRINVIEAPFEVRTTVNRETLGAQQVEYYLLRDAGDRRTYVVRYTQRDGAILELRTDEAGRVLSRTQVRAAPR